MSSKRDYYEILGVTKSASEDELKRAFRKAAVSCHPDRNPGDKEAEERFKELNEAYSILGDPQKRAAYDRFGHAGVGGGGFGGGGGFDGFSSGSFTDIFDNIFGDIFGGGAGGGGPAPGVDLRYHLRITFEEAAFGCEKDLSFEKEGSCDTCEGSGAKAGSKPVTCRQCEGAGQVRMSQGFFTLTRTCPECGGRGHVIKNPCTDCHGSGRSKRPTTVSLKIPAGVDSGQRMRLRGEGESADRGGSPGDLYVHIEVEEHPVFKREGEHVILDFPISFVQAALGDEVSVPTLKGDATLHVPEGTQADAILRLRGQGIPRLNGSGSGDLVVRIRVETPTRLTGKQRDLLKQFAKASNEDSHPGIHGFWQKIRERFQEGEGS